MVRGRFVRVWVIALFCMLPLYGSVLSPDPVASMEHLQSDLPFEAVREVSGWERLEGGFALGYRFGNHWFRFTAANPAPHPQHYLLEFSEPFSERCDFYIVRQGGLEIHPNGLATPLGERSVPTFLPTVSLELAAGERAEVYVRYASRFTAFGTFRLMDKAAYDRAANLYTALFMLYFGAVAIMIVYNLFLFLSLRDVAYGYYVGHAFVFGVWAFLYSGFSLYFIPAEWHYRLHFTTPLAFVFFALYSVTILETRSRFPALFKAVRVMALFLALTSVWVVLDLETGYLLANALGIVFFPFFIVLGILSWRNGVKTARYYLAALLLYLLTMAVVSNLAMGLIGYSPLAKYSFVGGSLLELTLFSLLLAYRIHLLRSETIRAQANLLAVRTEQAEVLERTVAEKTVELREANTHLGHALNERTTLLKEIHHRVKNNLQSIMGMLWMEGRRTQNKEARTLLSESSAKIKSIAAVHELLYTSDTIGSIDLAAYLPRLVKSLLAAQSSRPVAAEYAVTGRLTMDQAAALGMIAVEVVTNALKHADTQGAALALSVAASIREGRVHFGIYDNGAPFAADAKTESVETAGMGLIAQTAERLAGASYRYGYEAGTQFELEFDHEPTA
jgi:two-component sensor histidine kinase